MFHLRGGVHSAVFVYGQHIIDSFADFLSKTQKAKFLSSRLDEKATVIENTFYMYRYTDIHIQLVKGWTIVGHRMLLTMTYKR